MSKQWAYCSHNYIGDQGQCRLCGHMTREQYKFLGRETHYGFTYLIWVLAKNPRPPRILGQRWVQVVT